MKPITLLKLDQNPGFQSFAKRLFTGLAVLTLVGCAATTRPIDPNSEFHYDASYDFSDKKAIVSGLSSSLLADVEINEVGARPVVVSYGIANETSEHINTGGISDDIRANLIKAKQFRFVNRRQRENIGAEADYQFAGFVPDEDRVEEGRQLGADFILSGTLRSIEKTQPRHWRLKRRELIYYSMTLEMTDLTTGELAWTDSVEIARESSRPIIRW